MEAWQHVALGIGLAAACGFRVFVPLLLMGVGARTGFLDLSADMAWLSSNAALIGLATAAVAEVLAYYVPWVDNLLDAVATPVAMGAGTLASASVLGGDLPAMWTWGLSAIAGGGAAGLIQGGTVATRGASSASTGGASNFVVATLENVASVLTTVLAVAAPLLAAAGVVGLLAYAAWRLVRRRRAPSAS